MRNRKLRCGMALKAMKKSGKVKNSLKKQKKIEMGVRGTFQGSGKRKNSLKKEPKSVIGST